MPLRHPREPRHLKPLARKNRKAPTLSEAQLWSELRDRRLCGLKSRRQHPLDQFIVDFFAAEHLLIIEIDGSVHDDPESRLQDQSREARLVALGYRVIRFRVDDVMLRMEHVLSEIARACGKEYPPAR